MKIYKILLLLPFWLMSCQSKVDLPEAAFIKTFGTNSKDQFWDGLLDPEHLMLFGRSNDDFYLVKTNRKGESLWEKQLGDENAVESGRTMLEDNCNYFLLGWRETSVQKKDILLIKVNEEGEEIWSKTYGGGEDDTPAAICKLPDGGFCIAATTQSFGAAGRDFYMLWIDQDGNLLNELKWGGPLFDGSTALLLTNNNELLLHGYTTTDSTDRDLFIRLMDLSGNRIWEKTYGSTAYEESQGIILTEDQGYMISAHSAGVDPMHQLYALRLDANGNLLWEDHLGRAGHDGGQHLLKNEAGEYVLLGRSMLTPSSEREIYLVHITADGQVLSEEYLGAAGNDWGQRILGDEQGYYILGWSDSYANNGEEDAYLEFYPKS